MTHARWTIGQRLAAAFLLVLAVAATLIMAMAWRFAENERSNETVRAAIARTQSLDELERAVLLFAAGTRDALLDRAPQRSQEFAEAQARLETAVRNLQRTESNTGSAAQANAIAAEVSQYVRAARRTLVDSAPDLRSLAAMRASILARVHQLLQEHDAGLQAALHEMEANRRAATLTLGGGAVLGGVLLLAIGLLTVRSIRQPAARLVAVASALSAGEWRPALSLQRARTAAPARFEMVRIADAFGAAAAALEQREQRLLAHGRIAGASSHSLDGATVASECLSAVLQYLEAQVGVLYRHDAEAARLVPLASYAAGGQLRAVEVGEGIVGQCARDRTPVALHDIPAESGFSVKLGYDEAPPRAAAAVPILFDDQLLGVLLVASLRELEPDALAFLEAAAAQVAVGLSNASAYREVHELLARVRAQGEEIQAQNEELQAQHEEIQAQNEELQAQTEEIQAQNEDLQLQAARLRDQAGDLQGADERKNHFLGVLAHELRNPLAPIATCVELIKRNAGKASASAPTLQVLSRQVHHMTRLIDDLLDVTRISRGKIALKRERLNISQLVQECVADQAAALEQNRIGLDLELPEVPLHVQGDHTRLCQVFSNLLANAVKFGEAGTRISVGVTLNAPTREVAVHVCDDGIGIDPRFLARIFEPFTQAEDELARTKGGLGLGLALAKGLVELHGGRIEARSQGKGRGAEFIVTLALSEAAEHEADRRGALAPPARADAGGSRVLVIDDNTDAADSLAQLLELESCEVEVAYAAQGGLDLAGRFRPHVVLCDIGLPGMDGYEFARNARRNPHLKSALLVALTGYGSPSDQERATQAGFDVHMTKPVDLARLLQTLQQARAQAQ